MSMLAIKREKQSLESVAAKKRKVVFAKATLKRRNVIVTKKKVKAKTVFCKTDTGCLKVDNDIKERLERLERLKPSCLLDSFSESERRQILKYDGPEALGNPENRFLLS